MISSVDYSTCSNDLLPVLIKLRSSDTISVVVGRGRGELKSGGPQGTVFIVHHEDSEFSVAYHICQPQAKRHKMELGLLGGAEAFLSIVSFRDKP